MNPFGSDTKPGHTFEVLSDLRWHCASHELCGGPHFGSQPAVNIRAIKNHGYRVETRRFRCEECDEVTTHRRLVSLDTGVAA